VGDPNVVAAQMWKSMLQSNGVISDAGVRLHILSEPHAWIADPSTRSRPSAPSTSGRRRRSSRCSCSRAPGHPARSLRGREVDGAKPLQQFWKITLPLLWPAIFVTLIFRTLDALRVFDVFYVFFGNRLGTQSMAIYAQSTIVGDGYVGYGPRSAWRSSSSSRCSSSST
jgi:trehalose/maltose transport system permease protein